MRKLLLIISGIIFSSFAYSQIAVDIFPSQDNTIFSNNVNNSDGLGYIRAGRTCAGGGSSSRRGLLKFDIAASVPSGSVITSVTLDLQVESQSGTPVASDFSLYVITEGWGEGTSNANTSGNGVPATTNDATWNESFFGTTSWGTPGGSFVSTASATTTINTTIGTYSWSSGAMVSDVQNWLIAPVINHGWALKDNELIDCSARRFGSKDLGVTPVLHVEYTCPGTVTASCQDLNVYLDIAGNGTINDSDLDNGSTGTCPGSLTFNAAQTSFNCGDISTAAAGTLVITGVIDGPLTGGTPKAIELYAIDDIADLSDYGVGSANNGGGTDGEEFTFPAVAVTAGTFIYIATEATEFTNWFGFAPDYTTGVAPNINGDDAIELFENGSVIDVFGDINVDGTGQPWEYSDGWAYRNVETGPDGSTFVLGNWNFSGPDALDGESSNGTAATPFPNGSFMISSGFGSFPVNLVVTDDYGNTDNCDANVTVMDTIAPAVSCIGTGSFTLDGTGNLSLVVGDFETSAPVDACGVQSSTLSQFNFTCADVGQKDVSLIVTDIYGNQGTCVSTISIDESNPVAISVDNVTNLLCFGDSDGAIDVSVSGGNPGYTYDWDLDGLGDNDDTEDLTNLSAGPHILVVTDAAGCDDTVNVMITDPGNIDPTFAITNEGCLNDNDGALDMTIPGGTAPFTIDWDNDGTGDNDDPEDISSLAPGWYIVTITDANNCTITDSAEVVAGTVVDTSVTVVGTIITSNQAAATYQWVNCPGYDTIPGETSASYNASTPGVYAVLVSSGTCTDTSSCIDMGGIGFGENSQPNVSVYPNPTNGMLLVNLSGINQGTVKLIDINARVLRQLTITKNNIEMDLSEFENGVYFIEVSSESGTLTRKIVLQH